MGGEPFDGSVVFVVSKLLFSWVLVLLLMLVLVLALVLLQLVSPTSFVFPFGASFGDTLLSRSAVLLVRGC